MSTTTVGVEERLFFLSASDGQVLSMSTGGDNRKILVEGQRLPDGIVVDAPAGHLYWTNMGVPDRNDGSVMRCDVDGRNVTTIVPTGGTHTPKQICLDRPNRRLYWADREGMRMMRCNLDGSGVEVLVVSGDPVADRGDATKWCVGVALDHQAGHLYWTQKGSDNAGVGRILRAGIEIPPGETAATRSDIEVWRDALPEPIDLELDPRNRRLYWTDRGDPPAGNTLSRASVEAAVRLAPEVLLGHLQEGIGLALDLVGDRVFVTDLGGTIYSVRTDGSEAKPVAFAQGNLTGIAHARLGAAEA
jgi:hypothetical protein